MTRPTRAFTTIEFLIVLGIIGILATFAVAAYDRYRDRIRMAQATQDIGAMSVAVKHHEIDNREPPTSLAEIGWGNRLDPWGRPYQYLNLTTLKGNGQARKDKRLSPLNSDFDLYSLGKDGLSVGPLSAKVSRDDIVRARDGRFIGLASDFDP